MTTTTLRLHSPVVGARDKPSRGLIRRFVDAMIEARMRQAMRELAMHRHLIPEDVLEKAGYKATLTNDGALPFTR